MEMNTGIQENVLTEIKNLAERYGIRQVILFGSRARGDYKRTSDIDLAVTGGNVVRFSLDVEDAVSTLLFFDVVNLDGAVQPELLKSIKEEGMILYEKI